MKAFELLNEYLTEEINWSTNTLEDEQKFDELLDGESVSQEHDEDYDSTVYVFPDGSCIRRANIEGEIIYTPYRTECG